MQTISQSGAGIAGAQSALACVCTQPVAKCATPEHQKRCFPGLLEANGKVALASQS